MQVIRSDTISLASDNAQLLQPQTAQQPSVSAGSAAVDDSDRGPAVIVTLTSGDPPDAAVSTPHFGVSSAAIWADPAARAEVQRKYAEYNAAYVSSPPPIMGQDIETAIAQQSQALPASLLDAVRDVKAYTADMGGVNSKTTFDHDKVLQQQLLSMFGEDGLRQLSDSEASISSHSASSAAISRAKLNHYLVNGPTTTTDEAGTVKVSDFQLEGIDGGFSISYHSSDNTLSILKNDEDITAKILAGAFLSSNSPFVDLRA